MKKLFLMAIAIITVTNVWAQFPNPFLSDDERPNGLTWLPEPPELTSPEFTYDFYWYQEGRVARDDKDISEQAISDEGAELKDVFSEVLGVKLSKETTPEILNLAERATTDAHRANNTVKNYYKRKRPFAQFNEQSIMPETDSEEATTFSFPSGHSSRGWMFALTLATIAPEKAELLFGRAHQYARNRVICGHHWKTDIDASLMLASGIFAAIVCTDAYQEQLKKARAEYAQIKNGGTGVRQATIEQRPATSQTYNVNGTPAAESSRGVIIQNGQKTLRK
jgi:acid phosphatase (class A)